MRFVVSGVVVALVAATAASGQVRRGDAHPTPAALHATVAKAIAAEKAALSELDSDPGKARGELEKSLDELKSALAGAPGAGGGAAMSPLKQAILGDEAAVKLFPRKVERSHVRSKINVAIVRKEAALAVFAHLAGISSAPPHSQPIDAAKGITATFSPSVFSTFYEVDQTNTSLYPATIRWQLAPPAADPKCNGFLPTSGTSQLSASTVSALNTERGDRYREENGHEPAGNVGETLDSVAIWWHADVAQGGLCDHAAYDESKYGHDGTVTVTVQNKYWVCTASFRGTLTGGAGVPPDGAEPGGWPNGWRGPATCSER
jgi:hypothetical protein